MLNMAEGCRSESEDWRADLCIGDHLDAEDVCESWAAIISKGTEDEILTFLVEDENTRKHLNWCCGWEAHAGQTSINVLALGLKCAFAISSEMQSLANGCFSDFINVDFRSTGRIVKPQPTQYIERIDSIYGDGTLGKDVTAG